jgi:cobalt-zinc-cadmium efflux system membrane fusion protein
MQTTQEESIFITTEQFTNAGMRIGPFTDTTFSLRLQMMGKVTTAAEGKTQIGSFFGGKITDIPIKIGQRIQKGQTLIRLANPDYITLQQTFLETSATLEGLQQEYDRQATLYADQIASQKTYQQSKAAFETASASMAALREQLRLLGIDPEKLTAENITAVAELKAPFSGQVSQIFAENGQWLGNEQNALEIIDTEKLQIETQIFEKDLYNIEVGMTAQIRPVVHQQMVYKGQISHISPQLGTSTRSTTAIIQLLKADEIQLKPGMHVTIDITTSLKRYTALPETAIAEAEGQYYALMQLKSDESGYYFKQIKVNPISSENGFTAITTEKPVPERAVFLLNNTFQLIGNEE